MPSGLVDRRVPDKLTRTITNGTVNGDVTVHEENDNDGMSETTVSGIVHEALALHDPDGLVYWMQLQIGTTLNALSTASIGV